MSLSEFNWVASREHNRHSGEGFEPLSLPDSQKEDLARSLLDEFGAEITSASQDGELRHRCVMPWHQETRPSASLNYKNLVYKCLGCNSSGGLLWLIATVRGESGVEARQWLDEQTGLGGADFDLAAMLKFLDALYDPATKAVPVIPRFSDRVLAPWRAIHPWLTTGVPELGIPGRGIPEANIMAMQVGYAPDYKVGETEDKRPITSERIVIPHYWKGHLVGWQSRRLADDGTPKYLATGDFPKDRTIYNYDPKRRTAVVVESPMSVLRHLHHLPIEATFGASVTERQARLLAQHERVVLWMDPDPAGWNATEGYVNDRGEKVVGLGEMLEPYTDVWVVDSPWAADAADMDDETADALVADAVPYPVWHRPRHLLCWLCKAEHDGACP